MKQLLLQNSPPGSEDIVDFLTGKTIEYPESLTDFALLMALTSSAREGTWPEEQPQATSDEQGLTVARLDSRTPIKRAHIAIFPTNDWTEIPAYLDWGGKTRPACEYHVAALRSWRDRYGAELVGLDLEEMNVRVSRPPATREEALLLAREQYCYSTAIVEFGGVGSLSELAAILKNDPWWLFWWR